MIKPINAALRCAGVMLCGAAVALSLALTACKPTTPVVPALATPQALSSTTASSRDGCGKNPPQIAEFVTTTMDGLQRSRKFMVSIPLNYSAAHAYPVVFVFHGSGGNSAKSYAWGLQRASGAADAAIFVFPDGLQFKNEGIGWDDGKNGYDMRFFDNMLTGIESNYCVDSKRVFAAGFSWGGDFVVALSCARGEVLRAVAINSSTDEYTKSDDAETYSNLPCPSKVHPAARFEHAQYGDSAYPPPLFATTANLLRSFSACRASAKVVASSVSGMSCVAYDACAAPLVECTFPSGIGHNLPPNWATDTWQFFAAFQ